VAARAIVALGVCYLLLLGWSMANSTYDMWGLLVVVPPYFLLGTLFVRRVFRGEYRHLATIALLGLGVKLFGAWLRYWIGFKVYDGFDALAYHTEGVTIATEFWSGDRGVFDILPTQVGTHFAEGFTGLVYIFVGTSFLGGFVAFALLSFIGTCFFIKAACVAVPGLARRKYALLCVLAPSLMYWPSSIGKEAMMTFALGTATYGIALLFSKPAAIAPAIVTAGGLGLAAMIRPHFVGLWLAGLFPALLVALIRGRPTADGSRSSRPADRLLLVPVIVVAAIGLTVVAKLAVDYLQPDDDAPAAEVSTESITAIITETGRRTEQAGSAFEPPSIASPAMWPYASLRTLTRPLPFEVSGAIQMLTAAETAIFLAMCAWSWRRLFAIPKMIVTQPYIAFAMTTTFFGGLAFTSFANLAILARQRSLIAPFMLLVVCVAPIAARRREARPPERHRDGEMWASRADEAIFAHVTEVGAFGVDDQNSSMSPSETAQFDSGGMPASPTPRQVSTGPPPGKRLKPEDIWG